MELSTRIIRLEDEISKLEAKKALVIQVNKVEFFCPTEKCSMSFVPSSVEAQIKTEIGLDPKETLVFDQWENGSLGENVETILTQGLTFLPASDVIKSEVISRKLKFIFDLRLLPSLKSKTARKFVEITGKLGQDLLLSRLNNTDQKGIVKLTRENICSSENLVQFSVSDINWYLELMRRFIIHDPTDDSFYVPSFTLALLRLAVFRWCGLPQVGEGLNYIGKIEEEWIFNLIQSFDAKTNHPKTGQPLIRVIDLSTKEEIADVMAYDDKSIIVIESKFWDCPLLVDIEEELEKFERKVNYVNKNLETLGFPKVNVIPVFYTPFPPYAKWHGIQLVHSKFLLGMYFSKFFERKRPKLVDENKRLWRLVLSENYPFPYPVDASEMDKEIAPNTCRINDARVVEVGEDEIDVEVLNPLGFPFIITFDINDSTKKDLERERVTSGTLVRLGIVNLSGSWSISQVLYFRKIDEEDPERIIMDIWGNTKEAREITDVFRRHNLDIRKFITFCKRKSPAPEFWKQFLAARMGAVLFMNDTYEFVGQCECGQIFGASQEMVEQMKNELDGRTLCVSCLKRIRGC